MDCLRPCGQKLYSSGHRTDTQWCPQRDVIIIESLSGFSEELLRVYYYYESDQPHLLQSQKLWLLSVSLLMNTLKRQTSTTRYQAICNRGEAALGVWVNLTDECHHSATPPCATHTWGACGQTAPEQYAQSVISDSLPLFAAARAHGQVCLQESARIFCGTVMHWGIAELISEIDSHIWSCFV